MNSETATRKLDELMGALIREQNKGDRSQKGYFEQQAREFDSQGQSCGWFSDSRFVSALTAFEDALRRW